MDKNSGWPVQGASQLRCIGCGTVPERQSPDFYCSQCGNLLEVFYPAWQKDRTAAQACGDELRALWDQRKNSIDPLDQSGVWRFRELLPFLKDLRSVVTLREGNTPLYTLPRCSHSTGVDHLLAKHQGLNPTGSFKDTGMTAAISKAKEIGCKWVACASTGNTSASMAAYASRAGMKSLVLIPDGKISSGKLSQTLEYGSLVCQLRTNFDGCLRMLNQVAKRAPVYIVNSMNPYRLEGQKTLAIEVLEQLGWQVPDHFIVPGGNLANSSAIGKALLELQGLGLVAKLPKISIIQAEGANPLYRSMRESQGKSLVPVEPNTYATAIRIGNPASWKKAVDVLRKTGGTCEQVSEEEIAVAKAQIGAEGIGCEPASAVTLAGLYKLVAQGFVKKSETVVLVLTGNLLKDPDYTLGFHSGELFRGSAERWRNSPVVLDAELNALMRIVENQQSD